MKVSSSIGLKLNIAPYETMEVNSYIEMEVSDEKDIEKVQQKILDKNKAYITKQVEELKDAYNDKLKRLSKVLE